jgi:two-component system chemotaxis response regulator CheY
MPVKDGLSIVREVRQTAGCAATPLLVMSTDSQKHLFEQARTAGATGWLMKPVTQENLLAAVNRLLAQE